MQHMPRTRSSPGLQAWPRAAASRVFAVRWHCVFAWIHRWLSEAEGPAAATPCAAAPASAGKREELSVVPAGGQPVDVTPTTDVNAIYFSELDAARRCILQHPVLTS